MLNLSGLKKILLKKHEISILKKMEK